MKSQEKIKMITHLYITNRNEEPLHYFTGKPKRGLSLWRAIYDVNVKEIKNEGNIISVLLKDGKTICFPLHKVENFHYE